MAGTYTHVATIQKRADVRGYGQQGDAV